MKSVLVTLADRNYINQAKQLFSSAYWNGGWDGDYLLLAHEIPKKELKWFIDKGILIYPCKRIIKKRKYGELNSIVLSKFYLFTKYFRKWERIVFLDGDIIVNYSIKPLKNSKKFSASSDLISIKMKGNFKNDNILRLNNINKNKESFNSGVLSFDSKIIKDNTFNELIVLTKKYEKHVLWGEQPILNLYFLNEWNRLSPTYNINYNYSSLDYGIDKNKLKSNILHFCGRSDKLKPWNKNNFYFDKWNYYLKKSNLINIYNPIRPKELPNKIIYNLYLNTRKEINELKYKSMFLVHSAYTILSPVLKKIKLTLNNSYLIKIKAI
jgi:lipopolysaccharide biosynthesis glycosyltransferase